MAKSFELAELSEQAKHNAFYKWLGSSEIDVCSETEQEYYEELLRARGFSVNKWFWSIGSYDDFLTFEGYVRTHDWIAWRLQQYELAAAGPWQPGVEPPAPDSWFFALETLSASGMIDDSFQISTRYRKSVMYVLLDTLGVFDGDAVCSSGPLAGATVGDLENLLNCDLFEKAILDDVCEITEDFKNSAQEDYAYQSSVECFEEMADSNDWRFDEDGGWV